MEIDIGGGWERNWEKLGFGNGTGAWGAIACHEQDTASSGTVRHW